MKVKRSNRKITPHGGIVPILELIKKSKVPEAIRGTLGKRVHWATYDYEDVFIAMVLTILCGGSRIDHITKLRKKLSLIPNLKLPSHDTLGRVMKKLATESKEVDSYRNNGSVTTSTINENIALNEMLVKCTKRLGAIDSSRPHTLDIDATFVYTKSKEAKRKAKTTRKNLSTKYGHAPMVCLIDNLPVYTNLRSGNAAANLQLKETLDDCLNILNKNNIKINRVRSDAALGNSNETLNFLHEKGLIFNTRKPFQVNGKAFINGLNNAIWKPTQIKTTQTTWQCEIAEFPYKPYDLEHTFRIVAVRTSDKKTQKLMETPEGLFYVENRPDKIDTLKIEDLPDPNDKDAHSPWYNYKGYDYKVIITNDFKNEPKSLILEYNKRGGSERNFDYLKNNSGWKIPPFMRLNENTVYLIVAALANNVFKASVKAFKKHIPGLYKNCTLATFQFIFIDVACEYLKNKDEFVFYDTDIEFEKIC